MTKSHKFIRRYINNYMKAQIRDENGELYFWVDNQPIAEYEQLPEGYRKVKTIFDFIYMQPWHSRYYEMKKGTFILKEDKYVEYEIKDGLRDFHITDYIKENKCFIKTN